MVLAASHVMAAGGHYSAQKKSVLPRELTRVGWRT
jgi:hypothetical protein